MGAEWGDSSLGNWMAGTELVSVPPSLPVEGSLPPQQRKKQAKNKVARAFIVHLTELFGH